MHNLAISLQKAGHSVSGSDDEIYDPARSSLAKNHLLPEAMGWDSTRIDTSLDLIILGMHARKENPELLKAQELGLTVMSFPEFIAHQSQDKQRIVVAGSHGKTTTTSMIMHVLRTIGYDFDYLVGAQLDGFETMVKLSHAPVIVIEGDEYLSSTIDRVPKIWHYEPQVAVLTGVAWDHMNVFPTFDDYVAAFESFLDRMPEGGKVIYFEHDVNLQKICARQTTLECVPYEAFDAKTIDGRVYLIFHEKETPLQVFGKHNLANLKAAWMVLRELGITENQFIESIKSFSGASKRLQLIHDMDDHCTYLDFAHAPSKVRATVSAVKDLYPERKLTACVELHTYSSLNKDFLPLYSDSLDVADNAIVYLDAHTLEMKKMDPIETYDIRSAFNREDLHVFNRSVDLKKFLQNQNWSDHNLLLMSSGKFGGLDLQKVVPGAER